MYQNFAPERRLYRSIHSCPSSCTYLGAPRYSPSLVYRPFAADEPAPETRSVCRPSDDNMRSDTVGAASSPPRNSSVG